MKNIHNLFKSYALRPTYYYIIFILIFYFLAIGMNFPFEIFGNLIPLIIYVIGPLLAIFFTIKTIRQEKKKLNSLVLFGLCAIPGFISGFLFAYGFNAMGHGSLSIFVVTILTVFGLVVGSISGILGLLTNFILSNIKSS
jgi:FtsH-binding integral membrane protein